MVDVRSNKRCCLSHFGSFLLTSSIVLTNITDLPIAILAVIMAKLGRLPCGATDFARAKKVCKLFRNACNEIDDHDLEAIRFPYMEVWERPERFHIENGQGLINNCARVGNIAAQYLLAKVVLVTTTRLLNFGVPKERLTSTNRYRIPQKKKATKFMSYIISLPESFHLKLVMVYISNSSRLENIMMDKHLKNYVKYFFGKAEYGTIAYCFLYYIRTMGSINFSEWDSCLVRIGEHFFVKSVKTGFISPDPQLPGFVGGIQYLVDWKYADVVYEEVQSKALETFDVLIGTQ